MEKDNPEKKKISKKKVSDYIELDPTDEITELYYLQPDGSWKNNGDGRSTGKTRKELIDDGDEKLIVERAPLNVQQRRAIGRAMSRRKNRMVTARKRAAKKKASPEKLKTRARKKARGVIRDRLAAGKKYGDMSPTEKIQIDKRVLRIPDSVITRIATRQLPIVRKAEMERLVRMRSSKKESLDSIFEEFMNGDTPKKRRFHKMFKKEGSVNIDNRFKIYKRPVDLDESFLDESFLDEAYSLMEATETFKKNPKNREHGTDSLVAILKDDTPGQRINELFTNKFGK